MLFLKVPSSDGSTRHVRPARELRPSCRGVACDALRRTQAQPNHNTVPPTARLIRAHPRAFAGGIRIGSVFVSFVCFVVFLLRLLRP
jgi:hypothetical protein